MGKKSKKSPQEIAVGTYIQGMLEELREANIIRFEGAELSSFGRKLFEQLKQVNFRPTDEEIHKVFMEYYKDFANEEHLEDGVRLIRVYRDCPHLIKVYESYQYN